MMASRFLFVYILVKLFVGGFPFHLNRCQSISSAASMQLFDFSSANYWDEFYQKSETCDSTVSQGEPPLTEPTATEWHPSVSLNDIASVVPPHGRCLIIGCGNSNLPDRILKQQDRPPPRSLVLFDTSQTCLDQTRERIQSMERSSNGCDKATSEFSLSSTEIDYVCGDATRLSNYFGIDNNDDNQVTYNGEKTENIEELFDLIIDKGLTDAILCGEGWDGPLEKLLCESAKVLSLESGQYLLISYELPSSTKEFLVNVGCKVGLKWEFDYDLVSSESSSKNQHVSVAMATKHAPIT